MILWYLCAEGIFTSGREQAGGGAHLAAISLVRWVGKLDGGCVK
jgi:hypothetical protein